jgi:hypothetical protein
MISFERQVIGTLENPEGGPGGPAGAHNLLCVVGDLNRNGRPDIIIGPRYGSMAWFENPGEGGEWTKHILDPDISGLEAGGTLYDITGNGLPDLIAGGDYKHDELLWWENPGEPGRPWKRHVIVKTGITQFHDQAVGVVTPDGIPSLVFWNNRIGDLYRVPVPEDPAVTPWPGIELIRRGNPNEGIAIGDVNGDGLDEIVAGDSWYEYVSPDKGWLGHVFSHNYPFPRLKLADLDGDGKLEIIASEGDAHIYGNPEGGRAGWLHVGDDPTQPWEDHVLQEVTLDAHTLQVGDFCGNGHVDVYVGEMGIADVDRPSQQIIFENDGTGRFTRRVVNEGDNNHEGKAADLTGNGVLDLVGKPLFDPGKWEVRVYYNRSV